MLGLLLRYHDDEMLFRDLLAYVLELLYSVTRMIKEESKSRQTKRFADWWAAEPLTNRKKIERLRHAEIKRGEVHSSLQRETAVSVQAGQYQGALVNAGDSVTMLTWVWSNGPFAPAPVISTLQTYLTDLRPTLAEAERLLTR